jgi:serine/threonine protein kinase
MIGSKIGSYDVQQLVGEGGMGKVYRGVDTMLQRDVALKVLNPVLASNHDLVERFRAEAVTLAKLRHPNITQLYHLLQERDDFVMVMEFVEGQNLEEFIKKSGRLPCETAIPLFSKILEGFEYAHGMGVVHRDIKPPNIMITPHDGIKIMDFGVARVIGTTRLTTAGHLVGTLAYMSPEQIQGCDVDARSDIYSLGIVLYQMLTGIVPFQRTSDFLILKAQVEEPPPPPRSLGYDIPERVEELMLRAMEKNPGQRYQTAREFRESLQRWQSSSAATVVAPSPMRAPHTAGKPDISTKPPASAGPAASEPAIFASNITDAEANTSKIKYYVTAGVIAAALAIWGFVAWSGKSPATAIAPPVPTPVPTVMPSPVPTKEPEKETKNEQHKKESVKKPIGKKENEEITPEQREALRKLRGRQRTLEEILEEKKKREFKQ